jgi:hypothetical protein
MAGEKNQFMSTGLEIYFSSWKKVFAKRQGGK